MWRMYAPHKVKYAVSAAARAIAPKAGIKDVGIIGVDSGWEMYIAGNGGIKTEVAHFFVKLETAEEVLEYTGAFMQLYRKEGWYLERTVHFVEPRRPGLCEEAHPRRRRRSQSPERRAAVCFGWRARPLVRFPGRTGGHPPVRAGGRGLSMGGTDMQRRTLITVAAASALALTLPAARAQVVDLSDAINEAGRQRMLSQRMGKAWLALLLSVEKPAPRWCWTSPLPSLTGS